MENIYLKFPTMEDKQEWLDYIKEKKDDNPKKGEMTYDEKQFVEQRFI